MKNLKYKYFEQWKRTFLVRFLILENRSKFYL